jgi:hypothetical protein
MRVLRFCSVLGVPATPSKGMAPPCRQAAGGRSVRHRSCRWQPASPAAGIGTDRLAGSSRDRNGRALLLSAQQARLAGKGGRL